MAAATGGTAARPVHDAPSMVWVPALLTSMQKRESARINAKTAPYASRLLKIEQESVDSHACTCSIAAASTAGSTIGMILAHCVEGASSMVPCPFTKRRANDGSQVAINDLLPGALALPSSATHLYDKTYETFQARRAFLPTLRNSKKSRAPARHHQHLSTLFDIFLCCFEVERHH